MDRPTDALVLDPATWVDAHGDYLYRFALARVSDPEAAEELVQEALLAALTARHSFRGRASERSWLTGILKRKVVDWLRAAVRRRTRQVPLSEPWADAVFTRSGKWRWTPGVWATDDPGREVAQAEFRAVFHDCLDKLPARLRQAIVLRYLDEQLTDDVRRAVGVSAANLWVILHRSRLRLWQCLSVNWFGDETEARP